jgi:hypothetical protein
VAAAAASGGSIWIERMGAAYFPMIFIRIDKPRTDQ